MTERDDLSLADIVDWIGAALFWLYHAPLIELLFWASSILLGLVLLMMLVTVASLFEDRRFAHKIESERPRKFEESKPSRAFRFGEALARAMHRVFRREH